MSSLQRLAGRVVRRIRQARHGWSPGRDQAFHDALFLTQAFDPFTPSYPGYVTIRRFADHAEAALRDARRVFDLGCGPGEITCELARRRPGVTFVGVDHSAAAIERAQAHAARLGLGNATFLQGDVEQFTPTTPPPIDLVLLFDAFHHIVDPAAFVQRLGRHTDRFLLVEPRGSWHGGWEREFEFDWLVTELDKIRRRLASMTAEEDETAVQIGVPPAPVAAGGSHAGEPVEQRYTLDDLHRFFPGFGLRVHGTVAGIDTYPPDPYRQSRWRDRMGEVAYQLFAEADRTLRERDLDLLAKHLVIEAERGAVVERRQPPTRVPVTEASATAGAFDVAYADAQAPRAVAVRERFAAGLTVHNRSWRAWSSAAAHPIMLSYHWLHADGRMAVLDGRRTPLAGRIGAGETRRSAVSIDAPDVPGRYQLAIELVEEGVCWFSDAGSPWLAVPVRVR